MSPLFTHCGVLLIGFLGGWITRALFIHAWYEKQLDKAVYPIDYNKKRRKDGGEWWGKGA